MSTLEERFTLYNGGIPTKKELDEAVFNFLGFVKTVMLMAKDNEDKRKNESSGINKGIQQGAGRGKIFGRSEREPR